MKSSAEVEIGISGVEVGHWTDSKAQTGCTVMVLPPGTVASGEVRGGAPATREFALLAPERLVETIDAVVLTGGSAFGLATADGVMRVLEAEGRGYLTAYGRVPIVVAMALYDLGVGDPNTRPDVGAGQHAASTRSGRAMVGAVGAGTGATVSKWLGEDRAQPGGLGISTTRRDDLRVTAVVAANAAGTPDDSSGGAVSTLERIASGQFANWPAPGSPLANPASRGGSVAAERDAEEQSARSQSGTVAGDGSASGCTLGEDPRANTTLCAVVTNARLSKLDCFWVAQGGHDGLARSFVPAHCRSDGDAVVATATGEVPVTTPGEVDIVRVLAVAAVVQAVRQATDW